MIRYSYNLDNKTRFFERTKFALKPQLINHLVILTLPAFKNIIYSLLEKYCDGVRYNFAFNQEDLREALGQGTQGHTLLLSFGTGVIVSEEDLKKCRVAYNFHPASPDYPGLDPHHFAIYDGVREYGATCHEMAEKVDSGPIVMVKRFPVEEKFTSLQLLEESVISIFDLMDELLRMVFVDYDFPKSSGDMWGKKRCTKAKLEALCKIDPLTSKEEFSKILHAFQEGVDQKSLRINIHGHSFFYGGPTAEEG